MGPDPAPKTAKKRKTQDRCVHGFENWWKLTLQRDPDLATWKRPDLATDKGARFSVSGRFQSWHLEESRSGHPNEEQHLDMDPALYRCDHIRCKFGTYDHSNTEQRHCCASQHQCMMLLHHLISSLDCLAEVQYILRCLKIEHHRTSSCHDKNASFLVFKVNSDVL